ncbi:MAG: mRNA surveillance protein pelota [Halobacteriales archaeon]|nr:mRNA surveillance protein pelota [Halobacteriales archaeon]
MRIQGRETVEGGGERITLVPETVDDLWHLQYVVEPGDRVAGQTTRRIQRAEETMRDTGGQREPMHVTLAVDTVEFHRFADRLRLGGDIVACSREDQLGHHHTLNVEAFDEISVTKDWKPDQVERLEEAAAADEQPDVAIVTVEEGAAWIHTVHGHGTEEYVSLSGPTGKGEFARARSELFGEVGSALSHLDPDAIVLAGPGFTKEDALDFLEEEHSELADRVTVVDTSAAGDRGVHEVLSRGALDDVRAETRIAREASLIDQVTERIATNGAIAYGPDAVAQAVDFGAVETLLLVDERLREERGGDGEWGVDVDNLIESTEHQGGEVVVLSSEFDPGIRLGGLGGIAALLRYRIE